MRRLVPVFLCAFGLSWCGGSGAPAPEGQPAAGQSTSAAAPSARSFNRCPLTEAQVSAAVGGAVKGPDSSCSFFPEDKAFPNAVFVLQSPAACTEMMRAELEYKETVDGLGHAAYVRDAGDGSWLLVCRDGTPFEIRVDTANDQTARAAALALARVVLAAR